jgi:hypothetical protein
MGKQATVQYSSTKNLKIRLIVLVLFFSVAVVGCRGPWFKKTDNFDALVVAEKPDAKTPRGFVSKRLRAIPSDARNTVPRPSGQSRSISDDSEEVAAGDDLSPENKDLYLRTMEAYKSRSDQASGDLLGDQEEDTKFSMSDEGESNSVENEPSVPQKPSQPGGFTNTNRVEKDASVLPKDVKQAHSLSREGSRTDHIQNKYPSEHVGDLNTLPNKQIPIAPDRPKPTPPITYAGAVEPIEGVDLPNENKIKIETPKTDWLALANETRAAMQAAVDSATALSPAQKLALEAKLRMQSLIVDDLEAAMTPIEGLQPHEQEFFQHECQAWHAATDPNGNPVLNRRWTLTLQSHRKAQMNLAAVSNLEIQNATFCTEVDSFGIISKFPQYHFRKDQELLLYCELDNFVSSPVKDGFETQLQGSYEIVDSNGRRVADQLLPMDEHVCRNQRRDYFIAYRMYMPQDIKPGRYTLKLTIEDMKGHKFGQTNVDFQVVQ